MTIRRHLENDHHEIWKRECCQLGVSKETKAHTPDPTVEEFTQDGAIRVLREFIVGDDCVCLQLFQFLVRCSPSYAGNQYD